MEVINIGEKSSSLNSFVAQLRDKTLQKDSLRFRTNLNRLGQIFGYEISKTLDSKEKGRCDSARHSPSQRAGRADRGRHHHACGTAAP